MSAGILGLLKGVGGGSQNLNGINVNKLTKIMEEVKAAAESGNGSLERILEDDMKPASVVERRKASPYVIMRDPNGGKATIYLESKTETIKSNDEKKPDTIRITEYKKPKK